MQMLVQAPAAGVDFDKWETQLKALGSREPHRLVNGVSISPDGDSESVMDPRTMTAD
jgi:hypothetical protein